MQERFSPAEMAFTLVELAIVLVIIGLLVGGVLVGQDLIKSAAINATVSDIQSYTAAAVTFRDKYSDIPGDLRNDKAAQAGLSVSATNPGRTGEGDGDGILRSGANTGTYACGLGGENTLFWRQLSDAGLISFTSTATGALVDTSGVANNVANSITLLTPLVPQLRLRSTGFVHISGSPYAGNLNYYAIEQWTNNGDSSGRMDGTAVLTAREALGIDQKMDDGYPTTGTVLSALYACSSPSPQNGGTPSSSNTICYDTGVSPAAYATSSDATASGIRCGLQLRAGF